MGQEGKYFMYQHNGVFMIGGERCQENCFKIINAVDNSVLLNMDITSGEVHLNGVQIGLEELINKLK
jgi:hypothetical protein